MLFLDLIFFAKANIILKLFSECFLSCSIYKFHCEIGSCHIIWNNYLLLYFISKVRVELNFNLKIQSWLISSIYGHQYWRSWLVTYYHIIKLILDFVQKKTKVKFYCFWKVKQRKTLLKVTPLVFTKRVNVWTVLNPQHYIINFILFFCTLCGLLARKEWGIDNVPSFFVS